MSASEQERDEQNFYINAWVHLVFMMVALTETFSEYLNKTH